MITVTHIPGASSLTSSLVLSGLPTHEFFGGFLEKSKIRKKKQLKDAIDFKFTSMVRKPK